MEWARGDGFHRAGNCAVVAFRRVTSCGQLYGGCVADMAHFIGDCGVARDRRHGSSGGQPSDEYVEDVRFLRS